MPKRFVMVARDGSAQSAATVRSRPPRKGLKFCGRHCYLRYSVEVAKPIEKAQARLAEMRTRGLSPRNGGEPAKKRGDKITAANRRRALVRTTSVVNK
jgi:hypothetical protein